MSAPRLGLIANSSKSNAGEIVGIMHEEFGRHGVELLFNAETAGLLGLPSTFTTAEVAEQCDLLVVLGGDGTLLQAVSSLRGPLPPTFGINLGSLGFLTCVGAANFREAIEEIVHRRYLLSQRTLLAVEILHEEKSISCHRALNDAVISRGEQSRLIKLDVSIDGASLTRYNADGLIVSTPTGSTAYSLSAGGPVLAPESGVFVITPICPHVLTNRSFIVADESRIEITPAQRESVFLTLDGGNVVRVDAPDRIVITKSAQTLPLAMLPGMTFFEVLRQKLKWSGAAI